MALYDISTTKGFYTEYGNKEDICYYCKKEIDTKLLKKELSFDETISETRKLKGKLESQRVMKVKFLGNDFCICKKCMENAMAEMGSPVSAATEILDAVNQIEFEDAPILKEPEVPKEAIDKFIEEIEKPKKKSNKGSGKDVTTKKS